MIRLLDPPVLQRYSEAALPRHGRTAGATAINVPYAAACRLPERLAGGNRAAELAGTLVGSWAPRTTLRGSRCLSALPPAVRSHRLRRLEVRLEGGAAWERLSELWLDRQSGLRGHARRTTVASGYAERLLRTSAVPRSEKSLQVKSTGDRYARARGLGTRDIVSQHGARALRAGCGRRGPLCHLFSQTCCFFSTACPAEEERLRVGRRMGPSSWMGGAQLWLRGVRVH